MIAHLAGAMNIATWVMVDVNPYWGWGRQGRDTVWYPSVRIYRQQRMHRWEEVFEEIREDLKMAPSSRLASGTHSRDLASNSLPHLRRLFPLRSR